MDIMVGDLEMDKTMHIEISEKIKFEKQFSYYHVPVYDKDYILKNYCFYKDSFLIKLTLDKRDTIFFVNSKYVKKVYLGHFYNNDTLLNKFEIQYVYRKSITEPNEISFE